MNPSFFATSITFTKILPYLSSFSESANNPILSLLTDLLRCFTFATKQPVPVGKSSLRNLFDEPELKFILRTSTHNQVPDP